ncbi:cell division protein FtsQ/DivIB [Nocardioides sp.]|uniref:cell division protein FtsQ/DivIB n=1 Tax=Nocardioides sp. TaxID=35761 RepID=UPI002B2658B6|nr:FtsQ-type POTRA domain-containing protein [Nocardioides sp.]
MAGKRTAEERSRRRFARRQWARRWITWRYVLVVVVVLGLVGGGIYGVYFSRALSVQGVQVTGESTIEADEVLEAAAVPLGGPLATADLGAIQRRVENIDAVRSADVSRRWPLDVGITVEERVPVAVIDRGGEFRAVDETGTVFNSYRRAPADLPRIQTADLNDVDALEAAAIVLAAVPSEIRAVVDHLEVEGVDRIDLLLDGGRTVRWGSAESSTQKAEVLEALLKQPAVIYDVSVPGQPTTSGTQGG